jgi:transcriptional regulator with XRE-family HTH domain
MLRIVSDQHQSLAAVVGLNCAERRLAAGLTQEQFVRYARGVGLRWTASKLADFERGRREVAFGTVLAVSWALSKAQADAKHRGVAGAGPVTLADLLQSNGNVVLTSDGPDPLGSVVADVCRGRPWPSDALDLYGAAGLEMQESYRQIVESAPSALVDGHFDPNLTTTDLEQMRKRSGLTEDRVAQRLNISRDRLAAVSFRLWEGRTFGEERDRRGGPDVNQQKKGRISRELRAELEKAFADGNDQ